MSFSLIIGSHARGDYHSFSDFDVLLVDKTPEEFDFTVVPECYKNKVDFVRYTSDEFFHFYNNGSLFLFHSLSEGRLVQGDKEIWGKLREEFRVQKDFTKEIERIYKAIALISKTNVFGGKFLTPLANLHTEIKNACIFYLAHKGVFNFDKHSCIKKALPDHLYVEELNMLEKFYSYVVRDGKDLPFDPNDNIKATDLIFSANKAARFIRDDCSC